MTPSTVIGICTTCNNILNCFFRNRHNQPVWYCEQFDYSDYTVGYRIDYTNRQDEDFEDPLNFMEISSSKLEKELNRFEGLCFNCENRKSCSLQKPDSGVWYCEEYQ